MHLFLTNKRLRKLVDQEIKRRRGGSVEVTMTGTTAQLEAATEGAARFRPAG